MIHFSKLQLLDCLAAICAGSLTDVGVKLKAALETSESGGSLTLLPSGESWSLDNVLYYHSAMINALELDNFVFMVHVGQSAISVPLAMGQKLPIVVFNLKRKGNLQKVVLGKRIGTYISGEER